jgi:hypothetical protein
VYDTSLFHPGYGWAARDSGIMYATMNAAKRRPDVWLIDIASGRERLLLAADDGSSSQQLSLPVWSPDGRSILYDSVGVFAIRDAVTGAKRPAPRSGRPPGPCVFGQRPPCQNGTIVPMRWTSNGTIFSERLDWDGSTTIWRSTMRQPPTLYARLGKECKLVSLDRRVRRAVCQMERDESDVFIVTRP